MRTLSSRWIPLAALLVFVPSSASAAVAPVGACVDVGLGMLGIVQASFTGSVRLRVDDRRGRPWGLEYRHSVGVQQGSTLSSSSSSENETHVETLVIARETRRDAERSSCWLSLGLGLGRAPISVRDGVDFRGQPTYRAKPKLGLGLALAAAVQFPGLFGPVGSRIAIHEQLVSVSDVFPRMGSTTHVTLGLVY